MEISKALEIASLLAKGINPKTRKPFEDKNTHFNDRDNSDELKQQSDFSRLSKNIPIEQSSVHPSQLPLQNPAARKQMHQVSEVLVRLMADVHRGSQPELLDDYLSRRRKECVPSFRMIGIDDDNGWALIKTHWTILYWQERAIRAELLLKNAK